MMQRTPGMNVRGLPDTPVMNTHVGLRAPAGTGEYDAAAAHDCEFAAIATAAPKSSRARGRVPSSRSRSEVSLCSRSTLHAALPTMVLRFLLALALMLSTASALVVGSPRVGTRSGAASLSMGIATFRTGDKVQVITGADKGAVGKVRAATQLLAPPAAALRTRALAPHAIFDVWAARRHAGHQCRPQEGQGDGGGRQHP